MTLHHLKLASSAMFVMLATTDAHPQSMPTPFRGDEES